MSVPHGTALTPLRISHKYSTMNTLLEILGVIGLIVYIPLGILAFIVFVQILRMLRELYTVAVSLRQELPPTIQALRQSAESAAITLKVVEERATQMATPVERVVSLARDALVPLVARKGKLKPFLLSVGAALLKDWAKRRKKGAKAGGDRHG